MASASGFSNIEKLTESNYELWKVQMKSILVYNDLWSYVDGKTPFEAWSKRKPYVGFFKVIGSKAIVLDETRKRGKFQPKGDEYVLVGYSEESKTYRLWKPGTRTVIKARDVRFFEKEDIIDTSTTDLLVIPEDIETNATNNLNKTSLDQLESQKQEYQEYEEVNRENRDREESETRLQDTDNEEDREVRRGRGRPKLLKTGQPGRPKKIYQTGNTKTSDPETVSDALNGNNSEA